jgi:hypothetical protein
MIFLKTIAGFIVGVCLVAGFTLLLIWAIDSDHQKEVNTARHLNRLCIPHHGVQELKLINDGRGGGSAICRDGWVVSVGG